MKCYEDLTSEEKKMICNGCGGKGSFIRPPHGVFFKASCNHHDYGYWKGCTEADRFKCDYSFYEAMLQDCNRLPWYLYLRYRPWCWAYYHAVRLFGGKFFYYADEKREL